jgi:drug/metabolite transporter (DMT)-like permease
LSINPSERLAGIGLMCAATLVFAAQDAITKSLTAELPVAQIVFVRFAAFLIFALVYASVTEQRNPLVLVMRSRVPGVQVVRCLAMCAEIALFAYALRFLGIAEIHALFACFPLFVAALSVPLLGEAVGWRRWAAVCVGLAGTLIILRPGADVFNPYALYPLVCAVIYAIYNLLTRRVSRQDNFATSLVYFGLVGTLASGSIALFHWQPMEASSARLLGFLCLTSVCGHMMLIKALQLTEAVVLQPFHYLVLPWAIILGYLLHGEQLDVWSLIGASIVVGSGVYVAWREYRLSGAARLAPLSAE